MGAERLVKVLIPAKLVSQMDEYVTNSTAYSGRAEFITDAVANLLTDLHASTDNVDLDRLEDSRNFPSDSTLGFPLPQLGASKPRESFPSQVSREHALSMATIRKPETTAPTSALDFKCNDQSFEPTWGMHNRDWPTIWSASMLGRLTADGAIDYSTFKEKLLNAAREIHSVLRYEWDLSGFPHNESKSTRSEARFIDFFVGSQVGNGPLFSFGIAVPQKSSKVVLAQSGAELLNQLSGMTGERGRNVDPSWRIAFLRHLSRFAPADLKMLQEVVTHIVNGESTRTELISALKGEHPSWPAGIVETNAAGYVARAREWGILFPKQQDHRYVVDTHAASDIEAARETA